MYVVITGPIFESLVIVDIRDYYTHFIVNKEPVFYFLWFFFVIFNVCVSVWCIQIHNSDGCHIYYTDIKFLIVLATFNVFVVLCLHTLMV